MGLRAKEVTAALAVATAWAVAVCGLAGLSLGQEQAEAPPSEVKVYVSDIHDVTDGPAGSTTGGEAGGRRAVEIVGARNGVFSGKVVVRSSQAIKGLKATAGALEQGDAVIAGDRVAVRYGIGWDPTIGTWYGPKGLDILLESSPAEFAAESGATVVPIWITVSVPKAARPGTYEGEVKVEMEGRAPQKLPVRLKVEDWTVPDTQDWRTWVEMVQSPDTLSVEYDVPLWSERHFEMMGRSMDYMGQMGSRVVYVPLIARTNLGNAESMVRWVKQAGGRYEYDFSLMEKYLDLAEKHMGRPKRVIFYVWEVYLNQPAKGEKVEVTEADGWYERSEKMFLNARLDLAGKGPAVTVLDRATGKTETVYLPRYADPASKALWQPLWSGLRERMAKRGLEETMMLGVASDRWPTKDEVAFWKEVSSGLPWASCSHHSNWLYGEQMKTEGQLYKLATIGYNATALGFQFTLNPSVERTYGWKKPVLHAIYWRFQYFNTSPLPAIRHEAEVNITGYQRGIGHLGADFWFCIRDKRGRRASTVTERFPESYWHSLNIKGWMLGIGPDGPVGTARLEVFREGVEECEARIAIEDALTDASLRKRLGEELATRAQEYLDERLRCAWRGRGAGDEAFKHGRVSEYRTFLGMTKKWDHKGGTRWFMDSGWQERTGRLYALAGEVARKTGK